MKGQGQSFLAWGVLFVVSILLIVGGISGSIGRFLAVVVAPTRLEPTDDNAWS